MWYHLGILKKLTTIGVKGRLLRWIKDFLSDRTFEVSVLDKLSSCRDIYRGVPHTMGHELDIEKDITTEFISDIWWQYISESHNFRTSNKTKKFQLKQELWLITRGLFEGFRQEKDIEIRFSYGSFFIVLKLGINYVFNQFINAFHPRKNYFWPIFEK